MVIVGVRRIGRLRLCLEELLPKDRCTPINTGQSTGGLPFFAILNDRRSARVLSETEYFDVPFTGWVLMLCTTVFPIQEYQLNF